MKKHPKHNLGFTLIEALVAIAIFTLSIVTFFSVFGNGLKSTTYAKNKLIATYLAEEGIEYMRNLRDTYIYFPPYSPDAWLLFKDKLINNNTNNSTACISTSNFCFFKTENVSYTDHDAPLKDMQILPLNCGSSGTSPTCANKLRYDPVRGEYNYSSTGVQTEFIRRIRVQLPEPYEADNYVKVISTVSWRQGARVYEVSFSTSFFDSPLTYD